MSQAQAPAPSESLAKRLAACVVLTAASEIFQWCPRPRKDKAVRPVDDLAWTEPEKLAMQVISITYDHGEPVGIEYNARVRTESLQNDNITNLQAMDYAITMDSVQRMFPVGLARPFGLPSPAFISSYRLVRIVEPSECPTSKLAPIAEHIVSPELAASFIPDAGRSPALKRNAPPVSRTESRNARSK
jgi:hypothetical protein